MQLIKQYYGANTIHKLKEKFIQYEAIKRKQFIGNAGSIKNMFKL